MIDTLCGVPGPSIWSPCASLSGQLWLCCCRCRCSCEQWPLAQQTIAGKSASLVSVDVRTHGYPPPSNYLFGHCMASRILIVGLGNLSHPLTRHRQAFSLLHVRFVLFILLYSVGQLALDSLSSRLGVRLSPDKPLGGYYAEAKIDIDGKPFAVGLYKTRTYVSRVARPIRFSSCLTKTNRGPHEPFRPLSCHGSPEDLPRAFLTYYFTRLSRAQTNCGIAKIRRLCKWS